MYQSLGMVTSKVGEIERCNNTMFDYVEDQLLPIVKNKRFMVNPLKSILTEIQEGRKDMTFVDPFCGSGVVSRIAKSLHMNILASDNEYFSYLVNSVYLTLQAQDLHEMFAFIGGIDAYYSYLSMSGQYASTSSYLSGKSFLSSHYAPKITSHIEYGKERLFYSRENALYLDAVRNEIEDSFQEGKIGETEKMVAISSLLYEAFRVANISGTFTSFHKQLEGRSDSTKKRVTEDIYLKIPYLNQLSCSVGQVYHSDALSFVGEHLGDIVYLDPPSHPQQYGSAYHLLNSIALWDDFAPSNNLNDKGNLSDISGIRDDWKSTKSPFCSQKESYKALVSLINKIDAPYIILSYPSNGILSIEQIYEILSLRHESIKSISIAKTKKGGRSSLDKKGVSENLYIIGKRPSFSVLLPEGIEKTAKIAHIESFKDSIFYPIEDVLKEFEFIEGIYIKKSPNYIDSINFSDVELDKIISILEKHSIKSSFDALQQLIKTYIKAIDILKGDNRVKLEKRIISLLRYVALYEKESINMVIPLVDELINSMDLRVSFKKEILSILGKYSSYIAKSKKND